jgi:cell wall assembly regulator SMI1
MDILKDWRRIEAWLQGHAPSLLETLGTGASPERIAEVERVLGAKLPDEMKALYAVHDGIDRDGAFFDGYAWLPLEEVVSEWKVWKGLLDGGDFKGIRSEPQPGIRDDWWNPAWIPFTYNGAGDHHCVDLAPAPGGRAGQIITMWHDEGARELLAPSLGAWIRSYADGLDAGTYAYSEDYGGLVDKADVE